MVLILALLGTIALRAGLMIKGYGVNHDSRSIINASSIA